MPRLMSLVCSVVLASSVARAIPVRSANVSAIVTLAIMATRIRVGRLGVIAHSQVGKGSVLVLR